MPTLRSADASRTQNAAVWRIARPTHVRMPEMRDIPYRGRWASKMARHRSVSPLSQTGAGMPPAGYFGSRLRRSLVLASFVRALAEAGSRCWSADKLSAGSQCQWCSRQRLSNSHAPALPVHKVDFLWMRVTRECGISKRSLVSVSGATAHTRRGAAHRRHFCEAAGAIARAGRIDDFFFQFRLHLQRQLLRFVWFLVGPKSLKPT